MFEGKGSGRIRALWNTLRFAGHNLSLMLRSEWHRFGYACVNFGTPISMRDYCRTRGIDFQALSGEERRAAMAQLGRELMDAVGRLLARLEAAGAHVYIPRGDLDYALSVGLRMLTLRRLVEEEHGLFRAREPELPLLAYYANSIAHLI